jgi:glycerol kinase
MGGAALTWAWKNLGLFQDFEEMDKLAQSVPDSGDVYFIPGL